MVVALCAPVGLAARARTCCVTKGKATPSPRLKQRPGKSAGKDPVRAPVRRHRTAKTSPRPELAPMSSDHPVWQDVLLYLGIAICGYDTLRRFY